MFGPRVELARQYTKDLAQQGEQLGLIGPLELPRLWSRHIVNCALVAPLLHPGRTGDIGSGAGLPGLVLAIARPDVQFILIEPMERRVDWLISESARLGLGNVEVVRARAEEVRLSVPLDQVTARAVTALTRLIPVAAPLLRSGGGMVFLKGARVGEEVAAAKKQVLRARLTNVRITELGAGLVAEPTRVFQATVG